MTAQHVYIIESPSPENLMTGRCEGRALTEALRLSDTPVTYYLATTGKMFEQALGQVTDAIRAGDRTTGLPFIHISAHGDEDGVELTNEDYLSWDDLRDALERINQAIGYAEIPESEKTVSKFISRISLCFSTCDGFSAYQIHRGDPCPFAYLVGPAEKVNWAEALTAFQVFYLAANHRAEPILRSVDRMNKAIDREVFQTYESPELDSLG